MVSTLRWKWKLMTAAPQKEHIITGEQRMHPITCCYMCPGCTDAEVHSQTGYECANAKMRTIPDDRIGRLQDWCPLPRYDPAAIQKAERERVLDEIIKLSMMLDTNETERWENIGRPKNDGHINCSHSGYIHAMRDLRQWIDRIKFAELSEQESKPLNKTIRDVGSLNGCGDCLKIDPQKKPR